MGCNLCTLQKREEHYKLLYEIAQVSGSDPRIAVVLCASVLPAGSDFCRRCLCSGSQKKPIVFQRDEWKSLNERMQQSASGCLSNE